VDGSVVPAAPAASPGSDSGAAGKTVKPAVYPPTYSNTPTPFGDFTGPSFGPSEPDRFPLMKELQGTLFGSLLDSNRTTLTGWIDMSYNASTDRHDNRPIGFDYRANEFVVQQNVIRIDRPLDTGSKELDWGYQFDVMLPGTDYRYTLARGLFSGQLTDSNRLYGFDPVQFYVDFWFPEVGQGTSLLVGRFLTIGGIENPLSPFNILFTHSYLTIYTPFTATGALATTKLSDNWYVQYGLTLGSDVFFDPTDQPTFMGGVKWISGSKTDSFLFTTYVNGGNYFGPRQRDNVQYFDLVYTHVFTSRFQTISEFLFCHMTEVPGLDTVTWYGADTFFQYDFTSRLYGAIRAAVFEDSQGQRTGFAGLYSAITAGLTFKPVNWLFLRPELRFDHFYNAPGPFEDHHSLGTFAFDVIVRW
jgi:Putative beta-barrel porin-2, OmpL-like. bbp2